MNKQESDILNALLLEPFINQRILAEVSGHSLGVVNRSLKELIKADYLDDSIRPTMKAITEFKQKTPQRAIILAAGFGIYSLYNKRQVDRLIAAYFTEGCDDATRIKIYCYIAACGLLWSNWCEYKRNLGVEFGEYSLRQYRYAKDYYRIVQEELKKQGEEK